jgi:hypothetical protein
MDSSGFVCRQGHETALLKYVQSGSVVTQSAVLWAVGMRA